MLQLLSYYGNNSSNDSDGENEKIDEFLDQTNFPLEIMADIERLSQFGQLFYCQGYNLARAGLERFIKPLINRVITRLSKEDRQQKKLPGEENTEMLEEKKESPDEEKKEIHRPHHEKVARSALRIMNNIYLFMPMILERR